MNDLYLMATSMIADVKLMAISIIANVKPYKSITCAIFGIIGTIVTYFFGGWTQGMATLVTFMAFDYITGLLVAAVFKNSSKTKKGGLSSAAGRKGLVKKFTTLIIVACLHHLDVVFNIDILMNAGVIGFVTNEFISIVENAGLMGLPLPSAVTKAIEILNEKSKIGNKGDLGGNKNG